VSSGVPRELSPHLHADLKDRPRASDKDGAIELCFQLLSSGRQLGEVLAELAPVSGLLDGNSDAAVVGEAPDPMRPPIEALEHAFLEAPPLPQRPAPAGITAIPPLLIAAAQIAQSADPAVGAPTDPGVVRRRWAGTDARLGSAQRISLLLLFVVLLAAVPLVTLSLPRLIPGAATAGKIAPKTAGRRHSPVTVAAADAGPTKAQPLATAPVKTRTADAPSPRPAADLVREAAEVAAASAVRRSTIASATTPVGAPATVHAAVPAVADADPPVHPAVMREPIAAPPEQRNESRLSIGETTILVTRGDALLATGDIASARLFYRRGADGGDGAAALRLGETFDLAFLTQAGLPTASADAKDAQFWYRRARDLGDRDADLLLKNIGAATQ